MEEEAEKEEKAEKDGGSGGSGGSGGCCASTTARAPAAAAAAAAAANPRSTDRPVVLTAHQPFLPHSRFFLTVRVRSQDGGGRCGGGCGSGAGQALLLRRRRRGGGQPILRRARKGLAQREREGEGEGEGQREREDGANRYHQHRRLINLPAYLPPKFFADFFPRFLCRFDLRKWGGG